MNKLYRSTKEILTIPEFHIIKSPNLWQHSKFLIEGGRITKDDILYVELLILRGTYALACFISTAYVSSNHEGDTQILALRDQHSLELDMAFGNITL